MFVDFCFRYLAEVVNGPDDNYWIVSQLIGRHTREMSETDLTNKNTLGEPHFEDQWWIGAKSYVSIIFYSVIIINLPGR